MPRFRKKPVVIHAERWFSDQHVTGVTYKHDPGLGPGDGKKLAFVSTLEGEMSVSEGDWIVTGVCGEKYPCKDVVFQQTYELVVDYPDDELPETD